jgi:hypothetical protein
MRRGAVRIVKPKDDVPLERVLSQLKSDQLRPHVAKNRALVELEVERRLTKHALKVRTAAGLLD